MESRQACPGRRPRIIRLRSARNTNSMARRVSYLTFAFAGTNEGEAACEKDYRALAGDPVGIHRTLAAHYRTLLGRTVGITTPDEEFNTLYKWAIVGADRFVAYTPGVGTGLLAGFRDDRPGMERRTQEQRHGRAMPGTSDVMRHGPASPLTGSVMSQRCGISLNCIRRSRTGPGRSSMSS